MNRSLKLAAGASLGLLLAACAGMPGKEGNVDAVLTASGIDAQLRHLQQPLSSEGPTAMIPDEWITLVNHTVAETLQPDAVRREMKAELDKSMSGRELVDVQAFYESDTGKRVVAVENGEVPAVTDGGATNTAALDTIVEATGAGKAVSMLAERGLNEAFNLALKHRCFGLDKVPMAGLLAGFVKKAQLATLKDSVNTAVRKRYAALSAADRDSYLAFVTSGAGKKFLTVRGNVIADAAGRAGDALSAPMAAHVDALCEASKQASRK